MRFELNQAQRDSLTTHCNTAMSEVLATMAGFSVRPTNLPDLDRQTPAADVTGVMMLQGEHRGLLTIGMDRNSAIVLSSYMTGIMPEDIGESELLDVVAELVNLLAGRIKTLLVNTEFYFQLSPPFAVAGSDHYFLLKERVSKMSVTYAATSFRLTLNLVYIS